MFKNNSLSLGAVCIGHKILKVSRLTGTRCLAAGTLTPWGAVMASASILCRYTKEKKHWSVYRRGDACGSTFFRIWDDFLRGVIIAFHSPHCFSLALCLSALHVSARVTDGIMMMVQLYMQDQGEVRGINDWAGEWQKEHANPPQVWSCACVWVMVVVV